MWVTSQSPGGRALTDCCLSLRLAHGLSSFLAGEDKEQPARQGPEGRVLGAGMPLPEACEQEAAAVTAGRELSTRPGTDMVSAGPRKPRKFSKLVLLTASKDSAKVAGAKRRGVHCIMSLGVPGSATLAKALLMTHPEAQRALEGPPEEPEQKRCKPALGEAPVRPPVCCSRPVLAPALPVTSVGGRGTGSRLGVPQSECDPDWPVSAPAASLLAGVFGGLEERARTTQTLSAGGSAGQTSVLPHL